MALSVTHTFVSAIPDDPAAIAAGEVVPQSHWNAAHTLTGQASVAQGGTGLASGTQGGIPWFNATTTMASSALLVASALVLGGGAGAAPSTPVGLGTTTTVLHGNAAGNPSFGAVSLTTDVSGTLPAASVGAAGSNTQVQFNSSNVLGASANLTWVSPALTIGVQQTTRGQLVLANTAAGAFSTTVQSSNSASAAWTLTLPVTAGTNLFVLQTDGSGNTSWVAQSPPGAPSLSVQYNNAGSFAGMSGTSWDDTNRSLTMTGATVTTSHPVFDMTQTWNAGAVTFTGLRLNVTSTASAAASLLLDLQVASASQFNVDKAGTITLAGPCNLHASGNGILAVGVNASDNRVLLGATSGGSGIGVRLPANGVYDFGNANNNPGSGTPDTDMFRDAAAGVLAVSNLGSSTSACGFRVYNTTDNVGTGTAPTNYERGVLDWTTTANTLTIGAQSLGTGTLRSVVLTGAALTFACAGGADATMTSGGTAHAVLSHSGIVLSQSADTISWSGPSNPTLSTLASGTAPVLGIGTSGGSSTAGWFNFAGQLRVTSSVNANNTTVLATATGLSVALQAGRTYSFDVYLSFTCTAAQGIRAAMVATGGLTATAIEYDGWIVDSAANGIKGNAQSTALGTVVANAATTGTAGVVRILGTITVNVAGTLNVQFAQSVAAANNTTVVQGSRMLVFDMP